MATTLNQSPTKASVMRGAKFKDKHVRLKGKTVGGPESQDGRVKRTPQEPIMTLHGEAGTASNLRPQVEKLVDFSTVAASRHF